MIVYLINKENKEVISTYMNVINWAENFVEYNNGYRGKIYCNTETEYFTDKKPENIELVN